MAHWRSGTLEELFSSNLGAVIFTPPLGDRLPHTMMGTPKDRHPSRSVYIYILSVTVECRQNPTIPVLLSSGPRISLPLSPIMSHPFPPLFSLP